MAPEQARGEHEITPSADVFSLGCLVYACLTGRPPFQAEHVAAVLARILFEDPPPLDERRRGVPASFAALVRQMLAKYPEQRLTCQDSTWAFATSCPWGRTSFQSPGCLAQTLEIPRGWHSSRAADAGRSGNAGAPPVRDYGPGGFVPGAPARVEAASGWQRRSERRWRMNTSCPRIRTASDYRLIMNSEADFRRR